MKKALPARRKRVRRPSAQPSVYENYPRYRTSQTQNAARDETFFWHRAILQAQSNVGFLGSIARFGGSASERRSFHAMVFWCQQIPADRIVENRKCVQGRHRGRPAPSPATRPFWSMEISPALCGTPWRGPTLNADNEGGGGGTSTCPRRSADHAWSWTTPVAARAAHCRVFTTFCACAAGSAPTCSRLHRCRSANGTSHCCNAWAFDLMTLGQIGCCRMLLQCLRCNLRFRRRVDISIHAFDPSAMRVGDCTIWRLMIAAGGQRRRGRCL
jgi:hypothetical protein